MGTTEKLTKVLGILKEWSSKQPMVAVVSAISSDTKAEGTTSLLLEAADLAVKGDESFGGCFDKIKKNHMDIADDMIADMELHAEIQKGIEDELALVHSFCTGLSIIQEMTHRSHDLIVGCGERLSALLISGVLRANGIPGRYINMSNAFGRPVHTGEPEYHLHVQKAIQKKLTPVLAKGEVPVVTGFMGPFAGGIVKNVGRGYSDLTAALTAASVGAEALQVWKESDGVFTGNPTKIDAARLIGAITPREALELTNFGNEVLHPLTMHRLIDAGIPVHILNTFKPSSGGTVVDPSKSAADVAAQNEMKSGVTAICSKKNITSFQLHNNSKHQNSVFLAKAFDILSQYQVEVDLICTTNSSISMTISETVDSVRVQSAALALEKLGRLKVTHNRATLSAVGENMRQTTGLAARMFQCLSASNINVEMIAQGASEVNMSVVVNENSEREAIHALHREFIE